jgi:sigma-B regulation protein RsbU (phosphoserine phosphatase)
MARRIRAKVLTVILSTSLGALLLLSIACMIGIFNIRTVALEHSDQLGGTAAKNSQTALETQMRRQLMTLAQDKAALTDEKLTVIQNYARMISDIATHIATDKDQYRPRDIDYLRPDQVELLIPHLSTAGGLSLNGLWDEIRLMANIGDILRQAIVIDSGFNASYIGMETGVSIIVEKGAPPYEDDFDARTRPWYKGAKEKDGLFWTDVFADAGTKSAAIACAMPFYDLSGGRRVFKGVAGVGALLSENVHKIIDSTKIGETGYAFLLNEMGQVIMTPRNANTLTGETGVSSGEDYLNHREQGIRELALRMINRESGLMEMEMDGRAVYVAYHPLELINWSFGVVAAIDEIVAPAQQIQRDILALTENEVAGINRSILIIIVIIFAVIAAALAAILVIAGRLSDSLSAPIISLSKSAKIIGEGDLNHRLDVNTGDEIETLANSFNQMIGDIKTITAEKQRINSELAIASEIQNDMLPRIFPTFSNHKYFSLFAKMAPAKEVGGDFYDFFYLDSEETKIVLVIADVSGKGVPAALFMVIAKTLIKQQMLHSGDPAATLEQVNKILCEDNPRSMFVTVLIASLDLVTGQMIYANGGHNPPLLSASNQSYQFMQLKKGIPPGMMEQSKYKMCFMQLQPGDKLYLYTDGVNEAMNTAGEQFGNARFLETVNKFSDMPPQQLDEAIRHEVALFADGAEQSDDITTVAISYLGVNV